MAKPYDRQQPTISFRVTVEEKVALTTAAGEEGVPLAAYVRKLVVEAEEQVAYAYATGEEDGRAAVTAESEALRAQLAESQQRVSGFTRERTRLRAEATEQQQQVDLRDRVIAELEKSALELREGRVSVLQIASGIRDTAVEQGEFIKQLTSEATERKAQIAQLIRERDQCTTERDDASRARDRALESVGNLEAAAELVRQQSAEIERVVKAAGRIIVDGTAPDLLLEFTSAFAILDFQHRSHQPAVIADLLSAVASRYWGACPSPLASGSAWVSAASAFVDRSEVLCRLVGIATGSYYWAQVKRATAQIESAILSSSRTPR